MTNAVWNEIDIVYAEKQFVLTRSHLISFYIFIDDRKKIGKNSHFYKFDNYLTSCHIIHLGRSHFVYVVDKP